MGGTHVWELQLVEGGAANGKVCPIFYQMNIKLIVRSSNEINNQSTGIIPCS